MSSGKFRTGPLLSVIAGVALLSPLSAVAQQQGSEEVDKNINLDEIVVTGTRIKRTNAQSSIPLQTFSSEELDEIGTTDLAEALEQIPGVSPGVSQGTSNNSIQTAGLSTISLRRLGDDRTLVLVNGKRVVSNSGNSDRVSLSTLPVGFIERTEVTTGGASAIYGSDAIAGVANFVIEDDFEGFQFDARQSTPEASGGDETRLNLRYGTRFANDRGYFLFAASSRDEDAVLADNSRPDSVRAIEFDDPATASNDTFANELATPGCDLNNEDRHCILPSFSGTTPGGVFEGDAWFVDGQWFNDQSLQPANRSGSQDFFSDFDGYNFRPGRTLEGSREITNFAMTASFEFSPTVTGSATVTHSDIDSNTKGGFEGIDDDETFGFDLDDIGNISSSHPFIPPEVEETRSGSVSFSRRLNELGEQQRINNRKTTRFIADLKGSLTNGFEWEAYGTIGLFEQDQQNPNEVNFRNVDFALDIEDDGAGGFRCEDPDARAAGCVPLNIFGAGTISPAAADYIRYNGSASQSRDQISMGGFIRGDAFEVPAGPVQFVAGLEYRREEQRTNGDPDGDPIGGTDGDPSTDDFDSTSLATFPSVVAEYEVYEAFGELDVPIIEDKLNFQAAVRVGDYDTIGAITSYNAGFVFAPIEDIRFRAQYSRSQRAPNLTELFSPPRPDSDDLRDPCDELNPDGSGLSQPDGVGGENADLNVVSANCLSEPGIQAFFADPDNAGDAFEFDGSIQGPNAGNTSVEEETADTFTVGFVFTPTFVDNLTLIVDYYSIEIEDAITSISTQNTVDLCYSSTDFPNNRFCDVITRNPNDGEVVEVINFQENLNEEKVTGLDVTLQYELEVGAGEFDFDFRYTKYFDDEVTFQAIGNTIITTSPLGEIENGEDEWRAKLGYRLGDLRLTWTTVYLDGGVDDLVNDPDPSDDRFFRVGGQVYHRLYGSYTFGEDDRYRVYAGINNVADDLGPVVPTGTDAGSSLNLATDLNDAVGREFFAGARIRF